MTLEYATVVRAWLANADSDLATARLHIEGNQPHLDTGSYHCQQAAENTRAVALSCVGRSSV